MTPRPTPAESSRTISRAHGDSGPAADVRIAHLGLGNFFRAHQAWYTHQAPDSADWGIAAFTGRRSDMADTLRPQDGLYTLVTRGRDRDKFDILGSVSRVHAATEHDSWLGYLRDPHLSIVTLTVTEAGYCRTADGRLETHRADVQTDVDRLQADHTARVGTVPGRLVAGFLARRDARAGALTVLPCDNLPNNGDAMAAVVRDMATLIDPTLLEWVDNHVSFATCMVDRITPATTDEDRRTVLAATGLADAAPVVTEPFSEWVISGQFPGGRPSWETAGATFVHDVAPFEERKLRLLNGAHCLLAYAGSLRGHASVAEAIADPACQRWVNQWWDEATPHLRLPERDLSRYRESLLKRFANPRIRHQLAQIAADGSQKLPVRILPTLQAERAADRLPQAATRVLAAWVLHLRGQSAPIKDPHHAQLAALANGGLSDAVKEVLAFLDPTLADDNQLVSTVRKLAGEMHPTHEPKHKPTHDTEVIQPPPPSARRQARRTH